MDSFNYAIRGVFWAFKHERNFKIHTVISLMVIMLGIVLQIPRSEFITCIICIMMVLSGELINTAIEKVCDGITGEFKVYIKAAKDIAAGAVLVTAFFSAIIGGIIFGNAFLKYEKLSLDRLVSNKTYLSIFILVLLVSVVIVLKVYIGKGTPMQGGMPSGHTSIAFSLATIISLYSGSVYILILSFILAGIVAESRVESKIHNVIEVMIGGIIGILLTVVVIGIFSVIKLS